MGVRIQYMGTKQSLAGDVRDLVADLRPQRPLLDLFCGMCSVAGAVSASGRSVWGNDIQRYAALAARCTIASPAGPPDAATVAALLRDSVARNEDQLTERFAADLDRERAVLDEPTVDGYQAAYRRWRHAGNDPRLAEEAAGLRLARGTVPYRLATIAFAWGYFGLQQAIAIDSLRYAIDRRYAAGDLSTADRRWAMLALLQAASRLASGPGHLAQYLAAANASSLARVVRQRRRDIAAQFELELGLLEPYGDADWRRGNVVMSRDALAIWPELAARGFQGSTIYADPPYSQNQYSRFYHVLETLHRYDYPPLAGRGRYRPDRFHTAFSSRRQVADAFERLCGGAARLDCALVLSYPSNGLLMRHGKGDVESTLRRHFASVKLALRTPASHSTLGAAHGNRRNEVEELVYLAVP